MSLQPTKRETNTTRQAEQTYSEYMSTWMKGGKNNPFRLDELVHANGICIRWEWKWILDGVPVTRQVNQAIKRGDLEATYYSTGAGLSITTQGREANK